MKKNVALVIGQLSLGGSEKQIYLLARGLHNSGSYNVFVIVLSVVTEPYGKMLEKEGICIISLKRKIPHFDIFRMRTFHKIIHEKKIDILYSFSLTANFYSYFSLLFNRRVKFISGSRNVETNRSKLLQKIDDFIIRKADALVTNSNDNLEHLLSISSKPNKINGYVIHNGINVQSETKLKSNLKTKELVIGTVALFKKQKNYPLFIELCKSITDKYSNVNFISIGTGFDFDKMVDYAKSKNINSKIKFLGDRLDVIEIMSKDFNIFVLTSVREGLPNVIMEAMSCGLPVVATNVGGVSELVEHGKNGFLVPSGDLDGLVKYCKILINDPNLRSKMGQKGKDFIKMNYSSEKMVREFEEVFESLEVSKNA